MHNQDECGSNLRCNKAEEAGATACLLYNIEGIAGGTNIPSGSISLEDGLAIIQIVSQNSSAIFTFTNQNIIAFKETGGTMSSFSSFGLSQYLEFQPQLAGIGGNIYSTSSSTYAKAKNLPSAYSSYSSTMLASSYVAGTLALFLASIGNPPSNTINGTSSNGICRPPTSVLKSLFQSTATKLKIYDSDLYDTVARQGAGLVNAYQALTASAIFSPSELALNDSLRKVPSYRVKLTNIGNKPASYNIAQQGAALATANTSSDDEHLSVPIFSNDYAIVDINPTRCVLQPGQSCDITLKFTEPSGVNPLFLPHYSGFINATNTVTGDVIHLPYIGVVGDYTNTRIFVRNTPSGIVTGIQDENGNYITDDPIMTLNATNDLYGIIVDSDNELLYYIDARRNVPYGYGYPLSVSNEYIWYGKVSMFTTNPPQLESNNYTDTQLAPGTYRIRFWALKHFGNRESITDYEQYSSPPFQLTF